MTKSEITPLQRIWDKPDVTMQEISQFMTDKRLSSPMAICTANDSVEKFGGYETYPEELCVVFMMNNF